MKKFLLPFSTLFFLFFSFQNFGISQNKSIDFVLYEDATKTEYKLADMMKVIIKEREKQNTCTEFNQVPSIESAKSDYIFELWEFGESLKTSIFKEKRQRKITENNQTVVRDLWLPV